jgi:TolA-binding protein
MLSKDVSQELQAIFSQLADEGKEPSIALVKHRLTSPVPMPTLITALKSWKSTKRVPKVKIADQNGLSDVERIARLEQQVASLATRIASLETQLEKQS